MLEEKGLQKLMFCRGQGQASQAQVKWQHMFAIFCFLTRQAFSEAPWFKIIFNN